MCAITVVEDRHQLPMIQNVFEAEIADGVGSAWIKRDEWVDFKDVVRPWPQTHQSRYHQIDEIGMIVMVAARQADDHLSRVRIVILLKVQMAIEIMLVSVLPKQPDIIVGVNHVLRIIVQ